MPARNKQRGYELEKEAVELAQELGLKSFRCWGSDGRARGLEKDVDVVIENEHHQCKRRKSIAQYIFPSETVQGQIIRQDYDTTAYIVIPLRYHLERIVELKQLRERLAEAEGIS